MLTNTHTILVIDDEQSMIDAITSMLTIDGFNVISAHNGEEGLDKAFNEHPSLILLDLLMPKLDGHSMLNQLRADAWGKDIPVIILTNVSPDTDKTLQSITEDQPAYYLVKPEMTLSGISEKVKDVLNLPLK